ncbi:acetylserotonin O-methyltransferase-like isoform X2 [Dendropsophus ebraccatus]|uniref:acetylserotonin O-methyltransferase-like isoform X2 n=1 Tax=Dendropsophus ebraccatus TaxID=150705 RepID=UPI00383126FB
MSSLEKMEYPRKLLDYMDGFAVSKTIFTACELGVFDLLHEVQEPISAVAIASRLSTSVDGMERLLDACVGLELLKVDLKTSEGKEKVSMKGLLVYLQKNHLKRCTGKLSEEEMLTFIHFMDSIWNICGKDVIQAFDFSIFHTVYDLGGCSGGLAKQFVSTYKESTVTIMDMPKVVQTAKKHFITESEQQIHFLEGDFFNDPIPEADLYIMARIIHDWTEEKCLSLLRKIYQSCRPGGGVLIVEALLNEDRSGPVHSQLFSLKMLVQTEGKERMPSEYTKLLTDAGFRDIECKVTGKLYDAILGRK